MLMLGIGGLRISMLVGKNVLPTTVLLTILTYVHPNIDAVEMICPQNYLESTRIAPLVF